MRTRQWNRVAAGLGALAAAWLALGAPIIAW